MQLEIRNGIPFVRVRLRHRGAEMVIDNVLVDTGSGGSLFSADVVGEVGIFVEGSDPLGRIAGIGGSEFVFRRAVDSIEVGDRSVPSFEIEVGEMDYGSDINGIIGMDLLTQIGAVLNLRDMTLEFAN